MIIVQLDSEQLTSIIQNAVRTVISETSQAKQPAETERWFNLTELCAYLPDKPAKPTVYGWVQCGSIPCHKGGKKLRFLKSEIDVWLRLGKKKTVSEIESETDAYLSNYKKRLTYGR